jgi:hypothetical protein
VTRPLGDATSFAYDAASGYPSSITLGDGSVYSYTYSSHSVSGATFFNLLSSNDPIGATEYMLSMTRALPVSRLTHCSVAYTATHDGAAS